MRRSLARIIALASPRSCRVPPRGRPAPPAPDDAVIHIGDDVIDLGDHEHDDWRAAVDAAVHQFEHPG